jgi:hypothetical protein
MSDVWWESNPLPIILRVAVRASMTPGRLPSTGFYTCRGEGRHGGGRHFGSAQDYAGAAVPSLLFISCVALLPLLLSRLHVCLCGCFGRVEASSSERFQQDLFSVLSPRGAFGSQPAAAQAATQEPTSSARASSTTSSNTTSRSSSSSSSRNRSTSSTSSSSSSSSRGTSSSNSRSIAV